MSHLSEWPSSKRQAVISVARIWRKRNISTVLVGMHNWYNHYGENGRGSSNNEKQNYTII